MGARHACILSATTLLWYRLVQEVEPAVSCWQNGNKNKNFLALQCGLDKMAHYRRWPDPGTQQAFIETFPRLAQTDTAVLTVVSREFGEASAGTLWGQAWGLGRRLTKRGKDLGKQRPKGPRGEVSIRNIRTTSERGRESREAVLGRCGSFPSTCESIRPTATVDRATWAPSRSS